MAASPEFRSMAEPVITDMRRPTLKSMEERPFEPMPGSTAPHSNLTAPRKDTAEQAARVLSTTDKAAE